MTTTAQVPFGHTALYRLTLGMLSANALLTAVSIGFQIAMREYGDLAAALFQWSLLAVLIGSPILVVWGERRKTVPHTSEIICSTFSAAAVFVVALYSGIGWPGFWLMPPVLLSAFLIGGPALALRVHIREEGDRQTAELVAVVGLLRDELTAHRSTSRRNWLCRN